MRTNNLLYIAIGLCLVFTSCSDFLDTMPDNRTEIDSENKVTSLLVSAYPKITSAMMTEMASDNAMDNSAQFVVTNREQEQAYLWQDITEVSNDSPTTFWEACYSAIATANLALESIDNMDNPDRLSAQRGEALICRAYAHFALANVFCLTYNPGNASNNLGLPYITSNDSEITSKHSRGTLAELYANINADIEEALPLIDDEIYTVPKYHFNRKAAHAFAARFNLYYLNFDKVIEYADVVLGSNPAGMMKNWEEIALGSASNWDVRVDMYIDAQEPANLLLLPVTSSWGYVVGGFYKNLGSRYAHSLEICVGETGQADGLWGDYNGLLPFRALWGDEQKISVAKIGGYFYYVDKVNGVGYRKNVILAFSADETLLCRAEAHILKGEYELATADINIWLESHTIIEDRVTTEQIVDFYDRISSTPINNSSRTVKREIKPQGFTVTAGDQKEMIQCILHLRRIETIHEGLRWEDIKRYGIEFSHNRDGQPNDILRVDDPRRAIQLPYDVIAAGLQANPRN
ncbi:MAG: RagB/SusD family nutrient uptake outer membrane protein [Mangrovibacterium sp.]